jgi:hypothetical protein
MSLDSDGPLFQEALRLISDTPGYEAIGAELIQLAARGRIRIDAALPDRAQAGLLGTITLGPEALEGSPLSLAQTLVHEQYHLHQNPFLKTVSFWGGIFSRTPVMKRYEQPAYQAAIDFLEAVGKAHLPLAREAQSEQDAIRQVFSSGYGGRLD